ncbi:MAG: hypothetical protein ABL997_02905 [Planctomycetota bacterium]
MNCSIDRRVAFVLALVAGVDAIAQLPPGVTPPIASDALSAEPAKGSPAEVRWRMGQQALIGGDAALATTHLLSALSFHPASPPVLQDLVRAAEGEDARAYWLSRWVAAATDARGRAEPDAAFKKTLPAAQLVALQKLALVRMQAAAELGKAVDRYKGGGKNGLGNGAAGRWLATMFVELCTQSPALLRAHSEAMQKGLAGHAPDVEAVCRALLQVAQGSFGASAATASDPAEAAQVRNDLQLRAARILQGLARQSGYGKDLFGDAPPDLEGMASAAAAARNAVEKALPSPRVWRIDELTALDAAQRDAFTVSHRSWANPGIALSATGKYRIETTCGAETLLGTAQQIELHHARLVAHYGVDPFGDRQGTVLIVPEVYDMETEGMPFWWAGGFQGGDRTVVRFAWGHLPDLGRTLTHELTHRFDSVLRPFLRAWYGEGHASWTGGHYGKMAETDFTDDHLDLGACYSTYAEGYGGKEKFERLLRGELEEYRDNYFAGYTLYAFLRGYPPDQPAKYRAALALLEQNARAGQKDPVGYFTKVVCDGQQGRAAGLDAFLVEWNAFLAGIAAHLDPRRRGPDNDWVAKYGPRTPGDTAPLVLDENTWSWARQRAEPFFGQGHAGAAGDVLHEAGHREAACAAWMWSLSCEGWHAARAQKAVQTLATVSQNDQSAALRQLAHARFPLAVKPWCETGNAAPMPMLGKLPKTKAYLEALATTALALDPSYAIARAGLLAERERLAGLCGELAEADAEALPPPPFPRSVLGFSLVDDRHVDFDKGRVDGLWFVTPDGDVHIGRSASAATTGLERESKSRNVFVRTVEWFPPGEHVFKLRVHLTTSYVDGAIIVGHWRRDRGIKIGFSAGDPEFAAGRKDTQIECDRVSLQLDGKWERDGQLPRTTAVPVVEFDRSKPSFEIELRLRGPTLTVAVEGRDQFRYTTHDGAPIEGYLGFASSRGAYRVQSPTVERLDLALPGQAVAAAAAIGLDIARPSSLTVEQLVGLRVKGLPTGPVGTLVLWLPPVEADDELGRRLPRSLPVLARMLQDTVEFPQRWVLAVPKGSKPEEVAAAQTALKEVRPAPMELVEHSVKSPLISSPWVLFVDSNGVLRGANQVGEAELFTVVQRWARMFRAR